jgi:hypothetical integral membrane protein (TIGR02206 family)
MDFFDYYTYGIPFHLFGLQHLIGVILFAIVPITILLTNHKRIKLNKNEKKIRLFVAFITLLTEFSLYLWYLLNGISDFRLILPLGICGMSLYFSSFAMILKSKRLFNMISFFLYGPIASFLLADILHGFERIRFYQFFIIHGAIFINVLYLYKVHNFKPDVKGFKDANILLTFFLFISLIIDFATNANFFYLNYPLFEDAPVFQYLYDTNHLFYAAFVIFCYYIVTYLNSIPYKIINKEFKTNKNF